MKPGFTAETALYTFERQRYRSVFRADARQGGKGVTPALLPVGCYIGEYTRCLQGGQSSSWCNVAAWAVCLKRMVWPPL